MIKNYKVNSITDDEKLLLEQYRKLTPTQKKKIMKFRLKNKCTSNMSGKVQE